MTEEIKSDLKKFPDVYHSFSSVSKEVEKGIKSMKKLSAFMGKVCSARQSAAKDIIKYAQNEIGTDHKDQHGDFTRYSQACYGTAKSIGSQAGAELEIVTKLQAEVADPLQEFARDHDEKRKQLLKDEQVLTKELRVAYEKLRKARAKLFSLVDDIKVREHELNEKAAAVTPKKSSFLSKMKDAVDKIKERDPVKMRADAEKMAVAYVAIIKQANDEQTLYYTKQLPLLLGKMQSLEIERVERVKTIMKRYNEIERASLPPQQDHFTKYDVVLDSMDARLDIHDFVEAVITMNGPAASPQPFVYDLPCTPEDIKADRMEGGNPNSPFKCTLDQLMTKQEKAHPELDLPIILLKLVDGIRDHRGLDSEGIFRQSPLKTEYDVLKAQLDQGNFDLKFKNADTPAALLKTWIRELSDPLIPAEFYVDALALANKDKYTTAEVMAVFGKLTPVHQRVIKYIAELMGDISNEKHVAKTRMPISNLAILFAPGFLRSSSDDFLEIVNSNKAEIRFTAMLFAALCGREEVWITEERVREESRKKEAAKAELKEKEESERQAKIAAEKERRQKEREAKEAMFEADTELEAAKKEKEAREAREAAIRAQEKHELEQRELEIQAERERVLKERQAIEDQVKEIRMAVEAEMKVDTSAGAALESTESTSSLPEPASPASVPTPMAAAVAETRTDGDEDFLAKKGPPPPLPTTKPPPIPARKDE